MPDIFNLPEGNVFEWGEKGALLDLKPLYEEAGVNPSDVSVDSAIFSTDENVWSVGYNVTTMCMYYNKELLEQNGIALPSTDASKPWSWDEFVENAKKITKDSNGNGPGDAGFDPDNITVYGTMMPTDWTKYIALLHTNDVGILNEEGTELGIRYRGDSVYCRFGECDSLRTLQCHGERRFFRCICHVNERAGCYGN